MPVRAQRLGRREFLRHGSIALLGGAIGGALSGCSQTTSDAKVRLDLKLESTLTSSRHRPPYRSASPSCLDHMRRGEGCAIDYAQIQGLHQTEICPAARGVVIGVRNHPMLGMFSTIAHGLGWKSMYAHLQARHAQVGDTVARRDIVAIMGNSGTGGTRGGLQDEHLHFEVFGPLWTPLFRGVLFWDNRFQGDGGYFRYSIDPEELSLGGKSQFLYYSREEDEAQDRAFLMKHDAAVKFCDHLLNRLADADAEQIKARRPAERETGFDAHVDGRIWGLWQRLLRGTHPFSISQVEEYRVTLLDFMATTPRLTSPIVEPARREEYDKHYVR